MQSFKRISIKNHERFNDLKISHDINNDFDFIAFKNIKNMSVKVKSDDAKMNDV